MSETGETVNFCGNCGTAIRGGKFCTQCGTPSGFHQVITPEMAAAALTTDVEEPANGHAPLPPVAGPHTASGSWPAFAGTVEGPPTASGTFPAYTAEPPPPPPTSPPPPRSRSGKTWALIAGVGGALVIAVIAIVAIVVVTGEDDPAPQAASGSNLGRAYEEQVAKAFGPVLGANMALSERLVAIRGTDPHAAKVAVRQAQQATTAASGALDALTVPDGQEKLAGAGQQVLDREVAYLAAVSAVLNRPTVAGASQLQTLSSNLTSALDAAGPAIAGEQPTVQGADRLTSWAHTTSRAIAKKKRDDAKKNKKSKGSSTPTPSSPAPAAPSRGTGCGGGLYAGPNTSCAFARNVRDAYYEAPGAANSVRVYSPVTGETYTMHCRPSGSGTTCSGGNNASVTF